MKFIVSEAFEPKLKWTSLPEAAIRVNLICPRCDISYPVCHRECGMHVKIAIALSSKAICTVCHDSGHDGALPVDIADCPNCGLECRTMDQVVSSNSVRCSKQQFPRNANESRRLPKVKGSCHLCGSQYGIHTHHLDWHHDNNRASNLTTLCHYCHEQAHKLGKPLFDRLFQRVNSNAAERDMLRHSSLQRHRELFGPISDIR